MVSNAHDSKADDAPVRFSWAGLCAGAWRLGPVSIFVLPFGLAYGGAAKDAGLGPLEATLTSALVFAGAAQFAALDLAGNPAALLSLALVVLAVNARHTVLGAALAPWLNRLPFGRRMIACMMISDANFTVARTAFRSGETDAGILVGGGLVLWSVWVVSTALGVGAGQAIGDMTRFGFDTVMVCFFAAMVVREVRAGSSKPGIMATVLAAVAVVLLTARLLPVGWDVIAAALAGGLVNWAVGRDG